jgi:hypothetical protein
MTDEANDHTFAVGYKKPPRHSRFQPGQSGNPRGRQKSVRNLATDVKRMLEVPVRLNDQGKARRVSTQEAALLRLREKALMGDARSLAQFLQLAKIFNSSAVTSAGGEALAAEDQVILDAFAEDIRSQQPAAVSDVKPIAADHDTMNRDG